MTLFPEHSNYLPTYLDVAAKAGGAYKSRLEVEWNKYRLKRGSKVWFKWAASSDGLLMKCADSYCLICKVNCPSLSADRSEFKVWKNGGGDRVVDGDAIGLFNVGTGRWVSHKKGSDEYIDRNVFRPRGCPGAFGHIPSVCESEFIRLELCGRNPGYQVWHTDFVMIRGHSDGHPFSGAGQQEVYGGVPHHWYIYEVVMEGVGEIPPAELL